MRLYFVIALYFLTGFATDVHARPPTRMRVLLDSARVVQRTIISFSEFFPIVSSRAILVMPQL